LLVDFLNGPLLVSFSSITPNVSPWRRKLMMTTATRHEHDNTLEVVWFMTCELSENTWKLVFTRGYS
jgi:hypothetical protein